MLWSSVDFNTCIVLSIHHISVIWNSSISLKVSLYVPLCSQSLLPLSSLLPTTDLFSVSVVLPFQNVIWMESKIHLVIFLVSKIHLKFVLHELIACSFLLWSGILLYRYIILFIHLLKGHLHWYKCSWTGFHMNINFWFTLVNTQGHSCWVVWYVCV